MEEAELRDNIKRVQARIAAAAIRAGRDPADVTLVAVTKTVPAAVVRMAWGCGLRHFGENRVQEAVEKIPLVLPEDPTAIHWHMIGHLQRNKVKQVIPHFELIHSVDSVRLAREIARRAGQAGKVVRLLLEVNVAGEASKFGFAPEGVADALAQMMDMSQIRVVGLMTIAPLVEVPENARPFFHRLRDLRDQLAARYPELDLRHLSMGMTNDFEVAVEAGATFVRVGRAIFGERPQ